MDLLATLGLTPELGLFAAGAGAVAVVLVAGLLSLRRSRGAEAGLGLDDRG